VIAHLASQTADSVLTELLYEKRVRERLFSPGPARWLAAVLAVGLGLPSPGPRPAAARGRAEPWGGCTLRPPLYRIDLTATERAPGAKGVARLRPDASPFGLPVTVDGHLVLDVEVSVAGLPTPATFGPHTTFVAWAATPNLDQVTRLGPVQNGAPARGRLAWNKFMVFVSAEAGANGQRWSGPILLRGMSASGYMQNFSAHPLFNGGVPPC